MRVDNLCFTITGLLKLSRPLTHKAGISKKLPQRGIRLYAFATSQITTRTKRTMKRVVPHIYLYIYTHANDFKENINVTGIPPTPRRKNEGLVVSRSRIYILIKAQEENEASAAGLWKPVKLSANSRDAPFVIFHSLEEEDRLPREEKTKKKRRKRSHRRIYDVPRVREIKGRRPCVSLDLLLCCSDDIMGGTRCLARDERTESVLGIRILAAQ